MDRFLPATDQVWLLQTARVWNIMVCSREGSSMVCSRDSTSHGAMCGLVTSSLMLRNNEVSSRPRVALAMTAVGWTAPGWSAAKDISSS
jgi:hypothetical protein